MEVNIRDLINRVQNFKHRIQEELSADDDYLLAVTLAVLEAVDECEEQIEDYKIIREIEDNVRAGKKVVKNDNKYYACEFILAEHGTIRHLTISYNGYKKVLPFDQYKKSWRFEDEESKL